MQGRVYFLRHWSLKLIPITINNPIPMPQRTGRLHYQNWSVNAVK